MLGKCPWARRERCAGRSSRTRQSDRACTRKPTSRNWSTAPMKTRAATSASADAEQRDHRPRLRARHWASWRRTRAGVCSLRDTAPPSQRRLPLRFPRRPRACLRSSRPPPPTGFLRRAAARASTMARKRPPIAPPPTFDGATWAGVDTQRVEHLIRGSTSRPGRCRDERHVHRHGPGAPLVISPGGKEAVVAMLGPGDFFGEGCLAGQPRRIATASAMARARCSSSRRPRWPDSSTSSRRWPNDSSPTC